MRLSSIAQRAIILFLMKIRSLPQISDWVLLIFISLRRGEDLVYCLLNKEGQKQLAVSISWLKPLLILDLIPIKQLVSLWPNGEHTSQGRFPT